MFEKIFVESGRTNVAGAPQRENAREWRAAGMPRENQSEKCKKLCATGMRMQKHNEQVMGHEENARRRWGTRSKQCGEPYFTVLHFSLPETTNVFQNIREVRKDFVGNHFFHFRAN